MPNHDSCACHPGACGRVLCPEPNAPRARCWPPPGELREVAKALWPGWRGRCTRPGRGSVEPLASGRHGPCPRPEQRAQLWAARPQLWRSGFHGRLPWRLWMPSAPALSPHSSRGRAQAERATTSAWCREAALPPSPAPSPTGGQWGHTRAGRQRAFPTWSPLTRLCTSPCGEGPGVISPGPLPSAKMRPAAGWGVGGLTHPTAPQLLPPP